MAAHPYARSVADLLRSEGYVVELERPVKKRLWRPNGRAHIPFDVSFVALRPRPHREYIECKYRTTHPVEEQEVAKFLADLRVCRLATRYALMATNTDYTPLARDYAAAEGLRLYIVEPREPTLAERVRATLARPARAARAILSRHETLPDLFIRR